MSKHRYQFQADAGRLPIEQFSIDYEVPLELANRLIGRSETETEHNMQLFIDYLGFVLQQYRNQMG